MRAMPRLCRLRPLFDELLNSIPGCYDCTDDATTTTATTTTTAIATTTTTASTTTTTTTSSSHLTEFYLLPQFYRMILHLVEEGRDFTIVFRTYGIDTLTVGASYVCFCGVDVRAIGQVCDEFNRFCEGLHPLFPKVQLNGENGTRDLRVHKLRASVGLWR